MIEYNKKNARRWSIIGERPSFGMAVHELAKENESIMVVCADTVNSAGLDRLRTEMPDRIINVGIAEQNMMGIATGIASEGYSVITTTFAPFHAMRCLEQIRVNQGYMGQKVIMAGLAGGVAYGELGFTHCTIEDVSILRSVPNIAVVTPADCMEVVKAVEASISYPGSVYIRLLDKTNVPAVYSEDFDFKIGQAVQLREGGEIAIMACGTTVKPALDASDKFRGETGKNIAVYDFHTVKPLDTELLEKLKGSVKAIVTIEEHSIIGGLGGAISEYYSDSSTVLPIYRMGLPDEFPHGASHEALMKQFNLTEDGIYNKLTKIMEELS